MSQEITLEDGTKQVVYTQEEVDAQKARLEAETATKLAEKDAHHKTKLDEFVQGKKGVEQKEKDWEQQIADAKKVADEAKSTAESERQTRFESLKNYIFDQFGGSDPETKKKLEEAYELVNIPVNNEDDVKNRVMKAASMAGLANPSTVNMNAPMGGGYAPNFAKRDGPSDDEHKRFNDEIGMGFLNKPNQ